MKFLKSLVTAIVLFVFSIFAVLILFLPNFPHNIYDAIRFGSFKRRIIFFFMDGAKSVDIFGNVLYASMLNAWFIKHGGYHFGRNGETISSALGKNQALKKLTYLGRGLSGILDTLDKDHCWNSIDDDEYYKLYNKPESTESWFVRIITFLVFGVVLFSLYRLFIFLFL